MPLDWFTSENLFPKEIPQVWNKHPQESLSYARQKSSPKEIFQNHLTFSAKCGRIYMKGQGQTLKPER